MAPRPPPKEQLLGSVLWHAAGDALGFLVEVREHGPHCRPVHAATVALP